MQVGKELLFSPFNLCGKSEEQISAREVELEPWMSSHPLNRNTGPNLCFRKIVAALCPVDAGQKHQNVSVLICSTLSDLNTDNHVQLRSLDPDLILSFTKACKNQDLAVYDLRISLRGTLSLLI